MKFFEKMYFDPSHEASHAGAEKLANAVRGTDLRAKVVEWLNIKFRRFM